MSVSELQCSMCGAVVASTLYDGHYRCEYCGTEGFSSRIQVESSPNAINEKGTEHCFLCRAVGELFLCSYCSGSICEEHKRSIPAINCVSCSNCWKKFELGRIQQYQDEIDSREEELESLKQAVLNSIDHELHDSKRKNGKPLSGVLFNFFIGSVFLFFVVNWVLDAPRISFTMSTVLFVIASISEMTKDKSSERSVQRSPKDSYTLGNERLEKARAELTQLQTQLRAMLPGNIDR